VIEGGRMINIFVAILISGSISVGMTYLLSRKERKKQKQMRKETLEKLYIKYPELRRNES